MAPGVIGQSCVFAMLMSTWIGGKSAVLVGQTWHPLFGDVSPQMLNLSTGAPFQPFNRSPQIRYRYTSGKGLQLTGAVLWQLQYLSAGPNGKARNI